MSNIKQKYMPNFIGIDFGHGETSAAKYRPIAVNDISCLEDIEIFPGKVKIYSAIAKINGNNNEPKYIIGDEIVIDNIIDSEDYCICFKEDISSPYSNERHKIMLGHFMNQVYTRLYSNRVIRDEDKVYIACPTEWHKSRAIVESYKQHSINYGVPISHVFMESAAAYYRMREKKVVEGGITIGQYRGVLVIDFGSSTVDFTFFNQIDTPINKGYPKGASKVENIILEYILEHHDNKGNIKNFINTYKEKGRDVLLLTLRTVKEQFYGKQIEFRKFGCFSNLGRFSNGSNQFEGKIFDFPNQDNNFILGLLNEKGYLDELRAMLEDFKREIGKNQIQYVYLTGGASKMDFFVEMVCDVYEVENGITCTIDSNPSTTISQGIARLGEATYKWQEEEKQIRDEVEKWKNKIGVVPINPILRYMDVFCPGIISNKNNQEYYSISQFIKEECDKIFKNQIKERIILVLEKYKKGEVSSSGIKNIKALETELEKSLRKNIEISKEEMSLISKGVNNKFMKEIGDKINDIIANIWKVQYRTSNIEITIKSSAFIDEEESDKIIKKIHSLIIDGVKKAWLIFKVTKNTLTNDRDEKEREKIEAEIKDKLDSSLFLWNISFKFDYPAVINQVNQNIDNYLDRAISFAKLDTLNE